MTDSNQPSDAFCPAFRPVYDPGWLYPANGHRDAITRLDAGIEANHAVTLLTGDQGTGKTLILHAIEAKHLDQVRIGWLGRENRALTNPLHAALEALSVDVPDVPLDELASRTQQFLEASHSRGRRTLMILDDAHLLTDEELSGLRQLTELRANGMALMQLVLAGETGLQARAALPQNKGLRRFIGGQVHLKPFSASETVGYVAHRFSTAKCPCHNGKSPFDPGCLKIIHHWSAGVPGTINTLVQHCLQEADRARMKTIGAAFVDKSLRAWGVENSKASERSDTPLDALPPAAPEKPEPVVLTEPPVRKSAAAETSEKPVEQERPAVKPANLPAIPARDPMPEAERPRRGRGLVFVRLGLVAVTTAAATFLWLSPSGNDQIAGEEAMVPPGGTVLPAMDAVTPQEDSTQVAAAPDVSEATEPQPEPSPTEETPPEDTAAPVVPVEMSSGLPRVTRIDPLPDPDVLMRRALTTGSQSPAFEALFYERAALWGHARGAYYLGQFYEAGYGVGADANRARGWYRAATGVWGAQVRLEALTDSPVVKGINSRAVPVMQAVFPNGQTEIHWRSASGESPVRFGVDFVLAGGDGQVQRAVTDRSAIVLDGPILRWRIMTLDVLGYDAEATDWFMPAPPPR